MKSVKLRARKVKQGYTLYFDVYSDGRRRTETVEGVVIRGASSKKEALRKAPKELEEVRVDLEHKLWKKSEAHPKADFIPFFDEVASKSYYRSAYNKLVEFSPSLRFRDITESWGRKFRDFLLKELDNNTAYYYLVAVKVGLNAAVREGLIPANPLKYVRITKVDKDTDYLTTEEIQKIRDYVPNSDKEKEIIRAFLFACETGLRMSDVHSLSEIKEGRIVMSQKKSGKVVKVKLNERAVELLRDGFFNLPERKGKLYGSNIDYYIKKVLVSLGINKRGSFHLSRHTFGTRLGEAGVNLRIIQSLLGHSSISHTVRYVKDTDKAKDDAIDSI